MDSGADPVLGREAKRLSAPYLIEPVSPEQLLTLIAKLPSDKNRHWHERRSREVSQPGFTEGLPWCLT